jgi:hypothetical protein
MRALYADIMNWKEHLHVFEFPEYFFGDYALARL